MARLEGKVALITGAARGQGRSHAIRLASEGADIIAIDRCRPLATVPYAMPSSADLRETCRLVEELGQRAVLIETDVRDLAVLKSAVASAAEELGGLDIVCANAGICSYGPSWELTEAMWQEMLDVNLTGVWKTAISAIPIMLEQKRGGSLILVSSVAGLAGFPNVSHYTAAKHGVTGLMRSLAAELAPHSIRVNSIHPGNVATPMIQNDSVYAMFTGGKPGATLEDTAPIMQLGNALPVPWVDPIDVSHMVVWLASDESRYVTGVPHVIDSGTLLPFKVPHLFE